MPSPRKDNKEVPFVDKLWAYVLDGRTYLCCSGRVTIPGNTYKWYHHADVDTSYPTNARRRCAKAEMVQPSCQVRLFIDHAETWFGTAEECCDFFTAVKYGRNIPYKGHRNRTAELIYKIDRQVKKAGKAAFEAGYVSCFSCDRMFLGPSCGCEESVEDLEDDYGYEEDEYDL